MNQQEWHLLREIADSLKSISKEMTRMRELQEQSREGNNYPDRAPYPDRRHTPHPQ